MEITRELFVCQVAENLDKYMQENRDVTDKDIAALIEYSESAVQKFRSGVRRRSLPVAVALVLTIPQLQRLVVCPTCHRFFPMQKP